MKNVLVVSARIDAPLTKVWGAYTSPEAIVKWNSASPDWHTTKAESDLRPGGRFFSRMEAKDGSHGFDFTGTYSDVTEYERIAYTMDDGRVVEVLFDEQGGGTLVTVSFEPESENTPEVQQSGWQAILDNFKQYLESE